MHMLASAATAKDPIVDPGQLVLALERRAVERAIEHGLKRLYVILGLNKYITMTAQVCSW